MAAAGEKSPDRQRITVGFLSEPARAEQAVSEADIKKLQAEHGQAFLARLADPEHREEMLAQYRMIMRQSFPRVDQVLGLSPAEHRQLMDLFALQQLDSQEAGARCMADPACQLNEFYGQHRDTRQREIRELLGAERARKFETYKNTMGERESVSQLRGRLPDVQRLGDSTAELLITALAEERDLMHREASQRGETMNSFSVGSGMLFAPTEGGTFEERYEMARQNSQRLRDRAAQYLNADQMRAFNEMQDETLLTMRSLLRHKDAGTTGSVSLALPVN